MNTQVIAAGPGGFAGAGRIMCNGLDAIALHGVPCMFVGPKMPFPWRQSANRNVDICWRAGAVKSAAIGEGAAITDPMVLFPIELANELVHAAHIAVANQMRPLLWVHYLFPYGVAGLLAKSVLANSGVKADLWLNPAGSDIWEVGPQVSNLTKGLLSNQAVDRIVTYSRQFAGEIARRYQIERAVDVLKPCIKDTYRPLASLDRAAAKRKLGFSENDFLLSFHSNMRPVKAPEDVILVARRASSFLDRTLTLILTGPLESIQPYCTEVTIKRLGTVANVIEILQVADAEINLSRHDSFNLSLAEAMACGVPVISTDVVGIALDITAARAGELVQLEPSADRDPRNTYNDAVRAVVRFATFEPERSGAGTRGTEYARREFDELAYWPKVNSLLRHQQLPWREDV